MNDEYDLAVVGGGIAGLAIAEIFARSGWSVVLLERNGLLCQEASAAQHGWFHFGSLYSIFPKNVFLRTMVRGVENLLVYYRAFPGMNLVLGPNGRLVVAERDDGWFRPDPIEYIVSARNDPDFDLRTFDGVGNYAKKIGYLLTWEMAIKQFISRHQRFKNFDWRSPRSASSWIPKAGFADYSREVITKPDNPDIALDRDTHFRVVGYDHPMRASVIVSDLAASFLGAGGQVLTEFEVVRAEKTGGRFALHRGDGVRVDARRIVCAAGQWVGRFLPRARDVKIVASPLAVAYPALCGRNFVRMTPFVKNSINHLVHEVGGLHYSVIGGGYFADPDDSRGLATARGQLLQMIEKVFRQVSQAAALETYVGFKTEVTGPRDQRNYQFTFREIEEGLFAAVPGKFSLAFSLAATAFRQIAKAEPQSKVGAMTKAAAARLVGQTRHAAIVARRAATATPGSPGHRMPRAG
jgi:glycine/D-amino acid oxidase-like deaminating enzyme